jgi:hypothetical protein
MSNIVLKAEHLGILKLGKYEMPCAVLSNKKRVIAQREVVYLLTGNKKGGLDRYTNATGVRNFMPKKYVDQSHKETSVKFLGGGRLTFGYEATDIIDICESYLKAREAKALLPSQYHLATQAELIIRACAKVGIEALIDEATGYQAFRDSDELQVKFRIFIADDLREWTRTFPTEFFMQLYRLENISPRINLKTYPIRFGKYVMQFVYDTMDKDIADWLRENNPKPQGTKHHHQWLTEDFGYPKLIRHLMSVLGIMKASQTMNDFKNNLYRAYPSQKMNRRLRLYKQKAIKEKGKEINQMEIEFTYI